ncbi:MAG: hypothetical protein ABEJ02_04555 [Candidatus Paceibacteria bacterium]
MAGWWNYLAASVAALTLGLSSVPKGISSGTANSNDSLNNSDLENKVEFRDDFSSKSSGYDGGPFVFDKEDLPHGGKEISATRNNYEGDALTWCECQDKNGDGIYSYVNLYNFMGFVPLFDGEVLNTESIKPLSRGNTSFYFLERFNLDVDSNRQGEVFIDGIDDYYVYFGSTSGGRDVDTLYEFRRDSMNSRAEAVEKIGEIGANKARYLAGACNELANGNREPIKEFLDKEASSQCKFYADAYAKGGWEEKGFKQEILSDKVLDNLYNYPGKVFD